MTSKRKTTKTNNYQRYTCSQIGTFVRTWNKKYTVACKAPSWKTFNGQTKTQYCTLVKRELVRAAKVWRIKALQEADLKLKALKTQIATRTGYAVNSSKVTSPAIKRLVAKRAMISKSQSLPTIIRNCSTFKVTSYKNPVSKTRVSSTSYRTTTSSKSVTTALKREIQKLKTRNAFMKSQVAKFRREAAQLQKHYGTISNQTPGWNVVNSTKKVGQDVSNIVRFSNALNNAVLRQRKAS